MLLPRQIAQTARRPGLSLLEVLIALAIFLMSITAIWRLLDIASKNAEEAKHRSDAARIAHDKLQLVMAGRYPLGSQGDQPADDDDSGIDDGGEMHSYTWSMVATQRSDVASNLWSVEITVSWEPEGGGRDPIKVVLTQWIMDPNVMATTQDALLPQSSLNATQGYTIPGGPPSPGSPGTVGAILSGTGTGGN
jgi:prepilin-type N-terminal cleavage/methylation domain-containing protein